MNASGGSSEDNRPRLPGATPGADSAGRSVPRISAESLFAGMKELIIEHGPDEYRLRVTSNGKLILTK